MDYTINIDIMPDNVRNCEKYTSNLEVVKCKSLQLNSKENVIQTCFFEEIQPGKMTREKRIGF